jgi:hypothetical protein
MALTVYWYMVPHYAEDDKGGLYAGQLCGALASVVEARN